VASVEAPADISAVASSAVSQEFSLATVVASAVPGVIYAESGEGEVGKVLTYTSPSQVPFADLTPQLEEEFHRSPLGQIELYPSPPFGEIANPVMV